MNPSCLQTDVQKTASNKRYLEVNADAYEYYIASPDHNAGQYQHIILWKCDKIQISGSNPAKLKFRS
jgi:hypothetical protein